MKRTEIFNYVNPQTGQRLELWLVKKAGKYTAYLHYLLNAMQGMYEAENTDSEIAVNDVLDEFATEMDGYTLNEADCTSVKSFLDHWGLECGVGVYGRMEALPPKKDIEISLLMQMLLL